MNQFNLKIIEKKNLWLVISLVSIFCGFGLMAKRAMNSEPILNYGIDFSGGSSLILTFDELLNRHQKGEAEGVSVDQINVDFITDLRNVLQTIDIKDPRIQITEANEVLIKTLKLENTVITEIRKLFEEKFGNFEVLEVDFIGPSIGAEMRSKSFIIILVVALALLMYISWRFELKFGLSALVALLHDAFFVLSFSAIFQIEINSVFVAAILTILGYSINDTIVVFDRLRENLLKKEYRQLDLTQITNFSLNRTFVRTINTSITTLIMIGALLVFGGTTIKSFCLVLLVGILIGTYSSVCVAAPVYVLLQGERPKPKKH